MTFSFKENNRHGPVYWLSCRTSSFCTLWLCSNFNHLDRNQNKLNSQDVLCISHHRNCCQTNSRFRSFDHSPETKKSQITDVVSYVLNCAKTVPEPQIPKSLVQNIVIGHTLQPDQFSMIHCNNNNLAYDRFHIDFHIKTPYTFLLLDRQIPTTAFITKP